MNFPGSDKEIVAYLRHQHGLHVIIGGTGVISILKDSELSACRLCRLRSAEATIHSVLKKIRDGSAKGEYSGHMLSSISCPGNHAQ